MQNQKMQNLKMQDKISGVENAGPENVANLLSSIQQTDSKGDNCCASNTTK